jgi:hypothetical protein
VITVRLRRLMAREWEHVKRFLSRKDPNRMPAPRQEQRAVACVSPGPRSEGAPRQHPKL